MQLYVCQMRDVKGVARGRGTAQTERAFARHLCLENRLLEIRTGLDPEFQDLPVWVRQRAGRFEAAGADGQQGEVQSSDMFAGARPGGYGASLQPRSGEGALASRDECEQLLREHIQNTAGSTTDWHKVLAQDGITGQIGYVAVAVAGYCAALLASPTVVVCLPAQV